MGTPTEMKYTRLIQNTSIKISWMNVVDTVHGTLVDLFANNFSSSCRNAVTWLLYLKYKSTESVWSKFQIEIIYVS